MIECFQINQWLIASIPHLVKMADKYDEYDYEEVQGRAGRKGRTKAEVSSIQTCFRDHIYTFHNNY